jgi:hypothetical protein
MRIEREGMVERCGQIRVVATRERKKHGRRSKWGVARQETPKFKDEGKGKS